MLFLDRESDPCRSGIVLKLFFIYRFENLRYESVIIVDPTYIEISSLAVLNIK